MRKHHEIVDHEDYPVQIMKDLFMGSWQQVVKRPLLKRWGITHIIGVSSLAQSFFPNVFAFSLFKTLLRTSNT